MEIFKRIQKQTQGTYLYMYSLSPNSTVKLPLVYLGNKMRKQIAINIGGMKYQIMSNDCDAPRLERAVDHLVSEQKKRLKEHGHDNLRATIMIAISAIYEHEILCETLKEKEHEIEELTELRNELLEKAAIIKKLQKENKKLLASEMRLQETEPELKRLQSVEENLRVLTEKYEALLTKEQELETLSQRYEDLFREHTEIEEVMNFAIEETERLTQSIASHIEKESVTCH